MKIYVLDWSDLWSIIVVHVVCSHFAQGIDYDAF